MDISDIAVVIPALEPDEKLIAIAGELISGGFNKIVIVNDGSCRSYDKIFRETERLGCTVISHYENLGKGAAIKTGVRELIKRYGDLYGFITADADGQHLVCDITAAAQAMLDSPDTLVLGTRNFSSGGVPARSRFGNAATSFFFRISSGISCPDTQTGLRGIPGSLFDLALSCEGERYEYEMNFLADSAKLVPFRYVTIATVYENKNKGSHFRPIADSVRVYARPLKFVCSSLAGWVVDYSLFLTAYYILFSENDSYIFFCSAAARIVSGALNFLLNKKWSFRSKSRVRPEALKYMILFICQMLASSALTAFLSRLISAAPGKLIVDTLLFFVSYQIQKNWVFKNK